MPVPNACKANHKIQSIIGENFSKHRQADISRAQIRTIHLLWCGRVSRRVVSFFILPKILEIFNAASYCLDISLIGQYVSLSTDTFDEADICKLLNFFNQRFSNSLSQSSRAIKSTENHLINRSTCCRFTLPFGSAQFLVSIKQSPYHVEAIFYFKLKHL